MKSAPIKIVHLVNSLDAGGMENGIVNLAHRLPRERFKIEILCLERPGLFASRLPDHVPVVTLGKNAGFTPSVVRRISEAVLLSRPDVLHTHNLGPLIYAGLAGILGMRTPILHGEHSQLGPHEIGFKRFWLRRVLYRCVNRVHTVSRSLQVDLVRSQLPLLSIDVLVNGVDTDRFAPCDKAAAREQVGVSAGATVLGIVGRFGPYKRHSLMLDAFSRLAAQRGELHLLIVGAGGPEEERVREQARASIASDRIHFAGLQSDMRPWYQAMDLLVVPSTNEGLSNAVLEAMASGVPTLCHAACGNSEAVTHGVDGVLADVADAGQLCDMMGSLAGDRDRLAALGMEARKKAVTVFSITRMVDAYARLYEEIASESEPSRPRQRG